VRTVANQTPTTNNGTTHYVWDIFGKIIAEANGSTGTTLRETMYLEGMPLAAVDAAASPKKTYAVHVDHLNRPIMLTDAAKVNVWWASYEPFGRVRATGGTLTQNLGLPGQWFQLENGLAQNWHRHYDATTGRYTTADPLGFVDGPSVFAYAGNAPHLNTDPEGLNFLKDLRFDGPNEKYKKSGIGRIFGIRYKNFTICRIDYQETVQGSKDPYYHINFGQEERGPRSTGSKPHIPLNPRRWNWPW
jgi:RHS repeat-associated protein